ncbi:MAG: Sua5 family C-terminal domain-containing protein, partial [Alphaproteobacteria bacterium]|nr:Sua5 family C-terminal domain-containing protein [Alphaproteobacteria bacterium]
QKLLLATARPVAAPSANASGKLSPTTAAHVAESLGENVDLILEGGRSQIGLESTVINLATGVPTILRPGGITPEQIEAVLGRKVLFAENAAPEAPASPGMLTSHYAPRLPVRLNASEPGKDEAFLAFGPDAGRKKAAAFLNLSEKSDLAEAASNLFAMMRELDKPSFSAIAVAPIPHEGIGLAINDRLRRAAAR